MLGATRGSEVNPWLPFGLTVHGALRFANSRICCPSSNFRLSHQDGNSEYISAEKARIVPGGHLELHYTLSSACPNGPTRCL